MFCIFCKNNDTDVIETRLSEDGSIVRRRRECPRCKKRFTTYEKVEEVSILIIKRDGRRERFNREKLKEGIIRACEKTAVAADQIEKIVEEIEQEIKEQETTEVESQMIGRWVAKKLKTLDKIAYIRFASVFKRFVEVEDLEKEVKKLL